LNPGEIQTLLTYINDQIISIGNQQKETDSQLKEAIAAVRVYVDKTKKLKLIQAQLHNQERELRKQLPPKPETHGREFYEEIGHKGGSRIRALIQEGKDHEEEA